MGIFRFKPVALRALTTIFGLLALLALGQPALAAPPSEEAILKGLSARYKGLEGLSAAYSRKTVTPMAKEVFQNPGGPAAAGQLAWRKPANLRLDQAQPNPELMTTDGTTVWWYVPTEKQVHVYRQLDLAGEMAPLLSFLTNLDELKKNFRIKKTPADPSRPGQTGLILDPRKKDTATGQIVAWSDGDFQLTGFDLVTVTGEKTSFFLTEVKPEALDYEVFNFVAPKGVRVVEETER
jgi:outer membrane lipoprotein carrier protein